MTLIALIALHHLADVAFQPSWLIQSKKLHAFSIYEHVWIWAGVISLGLWAFGMFEPWKFAFLLIGHFVIDAIKYLVLPKLNNGEHAYWWIYPDQGLHYLQVIFVWMF